MSDEDEIGADENEPYDAKLVNVQDHSFSYASDVIEAPNDDEAIAKAHQWAWAECERRSIKKALLILTGGSIFGSYNEVIDLSS